MDSLSGMSTALNAHTKAEWQTQDSQNASSLVKSTGNTFQRGPKEKVQGHTQKDMTIDTIKLGEASSRKASLKECG